MHEGANHLKTEHFHWYGTLGWQAREIFSVIAPEPGTTVSGLSLAYGQLS